MTIETQVRAAIRDAVNRASRKPFYWGGLKGYQQLEDIADVLQRREGAPVENEFFQRLIQQVDRTLTQNQALAAELEQAHTWLRKVAACLRYPQTSCSEEEWRMLNSQQVAYAMENLLEQLRQESENKSILSKFHHALSKPGLFSSNKFSAQNPILKAIHATKQCFLTVFRSKMPWRCGLRPLESRTEQPCSLNAGKHMAQSC